MAFSNFNDWMTQQGYGLQDDGDQEFWMDVSGDSGRVMNSQLDQFKDQYSNYINSQLQSQVTQNPLNYTQAKAAAEQAYSSSPGYIPKSTPQVGQDLNWDTTGFIPMDVLNRTAYGDTYDQRYGVNINPDTKWSQIGQNPWMINTYGDQTIGQYFDTKYGAGNWEWTPEGVKLGTTGQTYQNPVSYDEHTMGDNMWMLPLTVAGAGLADMALGGAAAGAGAEGGAVSGMDLAADAPSLFSGNGAFASGGLEAGAGAAAGAGGLDAAYNGTQAANLLNLPTQGPMLMSPESLSAVNAAQGGFAFSPESLAAVAGGAGPALTGSEIFAGAGLDTGGAGFGIDETVDPYDMTYDDPAALEHNSGLEGIMNSAGEQLGPIESIVNAVGNGLTNPTSIPGTGGGGVWDNLLTIGGGLLNLSNRNKANDQMNALMQQQMQSNDPFASQRPFYQEQLRNSWDPNFLQNDPAFQAMWQQQQEAIKRRSAARGQSASGNRDIELMEKGTAEAAKYLNDYRKTTGQFAGGNIDPKNLLQALAYGNQAMLGNNISNSGDIISMVRAGIPLLRNAWEWWK